MSTDAKGDQSINPAACKPVSPTQDELKMGTNRQQCPRNLPTTYRPVYPTRSPVPIELLGPNLPEKRVPIKDDIKRECSNRLKVLEEQPTEVLKLGADLSGLPRTKMYYTPKNATEFREKERQQKNGESEIVARARRIQALLDLDNYFDWDTDDTSMPNSPCTSKDK